ncbi:MAG: radical SAM protein [Desulfobacteraceae bacterium]|nr:MAG: radical SAM protein [Desulfobacteraceae bacterium]
MKVSIAYPPLNDAEGIPLLSQNRQFQWFHSPTYIYPVVPAYAATLLKENGFEVSWNDGIASEQTFDAWLAEIKNQAPDLLALEVKTPVVRRFWKIVDRIKEESPEIAVALMGDHVTALPEESLTHSKTDFVLMGGDYDFLLLELCSTIRKRTSLQELNPGFCFRAGGKIVSTGRSEPTGDLDTLPIIDRKLTQYDRYAFRNGNFKYTPGTYQMAARDCWWGRCLFCSWATLYPGSHFRTVSPERHLGEIESLANCYRIREIFDDAGCFPRGKWLKTYCRGFLDRGLQKRVVMGCNMRVGGLAAEEWRLLGKCNFRMVLIGLESVNADTLKRLNKNIRVDQIKETFRMAKRAGLEPHVTTMVGYPWETKADAMETLSFTGKLFKEGLVDSLQATIVVPYPGTPLFQTAHDNGWLLTENWDDFDMRSSVWKSPITQGEVQEQAKGLYKMALSPKFLLRKTLSIRSLEELKYFMRVGVKFLGHLFDFNGSKKSTDF